MRDIGTTANAVRRGQDPATPGLPRLGPGFLPARRMTTEKSDTCLGSQLRPETRSRSGPLRVVPCPHLPLSSSSSRRRGSRTTRAVDTEVASDYPFGTNASARRSCNSACRWAGGRRRRPWPRCLQQRRQHFGAAHPQRIVGTGDHRIGQGLPKLRPFGAAVELRRRAEQGQRATSALGEGAPARCSWLSGLEKAYSVAPWRSTRYRPAGLSRSATRHR